MRTQITNIHNCCTDSTFYHAFHYSIWQALVFISKITRNCHHAAKILSCRFNVSFLHIKKKKKRKEKNYITIQRRSISRSLIFELGHRCTTAKSATCARRVSRPRVSPRARECTNSPLTMASGLPCFNLSGGVPGGCVSRGKIKARTHIVPSPGPPESTSSRGDALRREIRNESTISLNRYISPASPPTVIPVPLY